MEMHPYYAEIPMRSFQEIVRDGMLSEVLLALIVDPHEAVDISVALKRGPGRQLLITVYGGNPYPPPISPEDFANLGWKAEVASRITAGRWALQNRDTISSIESITRWNEWLGVWCAINVAMVACAPYPRAESALRRAAIMVQARESVESEVQRMRRDMEDANTDALREENFAEAEACASAHGALTALYYVGSIARNSEKSAGVAVEAAAKMAAESGSDVTDFDRSTDRFNTIYFAALKMLREVIADACLSFPR